VRFRQRELSHSEEETTRPTLSAEPLVLRAGTSKRRDAPLQVMELEPKREDV